MTHAQWIWEYMSLQEREKYDFKRRVNELDALGELLISILGLNLISGKDDRKSGIIPLSLLTGRREVIEYILEEMKKNQEIENAMADDDFETLSAAIASGEDLGDMEPMIDFTPEQEEQLKQWFTPGTEQELKSLGVVIIDEDKERTNIKEVFHHSMDTKIKDRIEQQEISRRKIINDLKNIDETIPSVGAEIIFDDD